MLLIRRIKTGEYVSDYEDRAGYRHVAFTTKVEQAMRFDETNAARLCDLDFFGKRYRIGGYNGIAGKPEYEREDVLMSPIH